MTVQNDIPRRKKYCNSFPFVFCLDHKEIRYIEGYREFFMTIWRQHFFGAANKARIRTPSPPLPDFLSATYACLRLYWCPPPTSPSPRGPPSNHREEILKPTNGPVLPPPPPPCCVHMILCSRQDIREGVHVGKERWGAGGLYSKQSCSTPKNLYTLEGTLEARLSLAGWCTYRTPNDRTPNDWTPNDWMPNDRTPNMTQHLNSPQQLPILL